MNLAFTLCSINYLAQAKVLSDSLKRSNPDWKLIIGLVDKNTTNADLTFIDSEILEVETLDIPGFQDMVKKYTIVELLTSVKPFYFSWLFNTNPDVEHIVYFDPDIMVLRPLNSMMDKLSKYDILLTPHTTRPINDSLLPTELHVKQTGIYNLGFLAVKRSANTMAMLTWWQERLRYQCIINLSQGLFVDQLWMDLVPAYFDKVLIDKTPGYNMAHWNLHERVLEQRPDGYYVNNEPLVFYHFSHYNPGKPQQIAAFHTRFSFDSRPDIVGLYETYKAGLLAANYFDLKKIPCHYINDEKAKKRKRELENFLRAALPAKLKGRLKSIFRLGK